MIILFCLTPVLWFLGKEKGVLINGLDTNFPLDPLLWFGRRLYVWNNIVNAGSDFSSSISGIFFHLIQAIPYLIGFSLRWVQVFSLVFWFSAIVLSALTLARSVVPKHKLAQIVFVVVYAYNTYLFNTWENIKVSNLALYASLPLFIATIYSAAGGLNKFPKTLLYFCLASILASGAGINPAYFSVVVFAILATTVIFTISGFRKNGGRNIFAIGFLGLVVLGLVNLFWILPLANNLLSQGPRSLADIGLTDWVKSLSENTSILNVMRLQGAWDWYSLDEFGMPQYLPYGLNYLYRLPFIIFSFILPAMALVSLFLARKETKHWYFLFGLFLVLGIFLGVGAHSPTGNLYLYLTEHIPFLSFFRSPWYIFTPILTLAYAGLAGLLFNVSFEFFSDRKQTPGRLLAIIAATGFVVANLVYSYPLVGGKIFRPGRSDSFYVEFPGYVWDAEEWLNQQNSSSRIITYPEDQLEAFEWGYRGTESVLNLLSNQEVITPSFNLQSKALSTALNAFFNFFRKENYKTALAVMRLVGADTIFVKKDATTIFPPIGEGVNQYMDSSAIGEWVFLKQKKIVPEKIFVSTVTYTNYANEDDFIYAAPIFVPEATIVNGATDTEVAKIENKEELPVFTRAFNQTEKGLSDGSKIALTEKGENYDIDNLQKYDFSLPKSGLFTIAIDAFKLTKEVVSLAMDGVSLSRSTFKEDGDFILVGPLFIAEGNHILEVVYPFAENILVAQDFSAIAGESGLRAEEMPPNSAKTLVAYNPADSDKKIVFQVKNFDPYHKYAVGFEYKYLYGSVPIIDIIQSTPKAPVKTFPIYPGGAPDWEKQAYAIEPVPVESKLELFIKMSPSRPGDRSKTYFENLFIRRIYDNKVFLIEEAGTVNTSLIPKVTFTKRSPVKYEGLIEGGSGRGYVLAFLESYNPNWEFITSGVTKKSGFLHFKLNGYANGWYIPDGEEVRNFTIYYKPQRLFNLGMIVSAMTILFVLGLALRKKRLRK